LIEYLQFVSVIFHMAGAGHIFPSYSNRQ